jgi:hypothetical protein
LHRVGEFARGSLQRLRCAIATIATGVHPERAHLQRSELRERLQRMTLFRQISQIPREALGIPRVPSWLPGLERATLTAEWLKPICSLELL